MNRDDTLIQKHFKALPDSTSEKPKVKLMAVTVWSRARQAKKALGLSGRQLVKHRKAAQRTARKAA